MNQNAVVAERRKRLPTIIDKLKRHPTMSVSTMQDLWGLPGVFETVAEVAALVGILADLPRIKNRVKKVYDYLRDDLGPRDSGYRAFTSSTSTEPRRMSTTACGSICRCVRRCSTPGRPRWRDGPILGQRVEVQEGRRRYTRFFVLVVLLMAYEEHTAPLPGAEGTPDELADELARLEKCVGVLGRLRGYAAIVGEHVRTDCRNAPTLEPSRRGGGGLVVTVHETLADAEARLTALEALDDQNLDAVLINIARISQLSDAYPNHFADTGRFTEFVRAHLDSRLPRSAETRRNLRAGTRCAGLAASQERKETRTPSGV